ncbi:MAG: FtsX-like permease family protein [Clostridium sp.]|uniref:ABC transporter permease n=1 Tax=Clostridium sp. TaxID=1506 RepID=UPI00290E2756|nr:FtsX-like permease family protein [Clostridium sp.]MDU5111532.1 FtsX-like permease family protein [Clostridium sp.]
MSVFKRAILYVTRKKMKSLIMLFILFGIATFILSSISIKKAATIARLDSNRDIANSFEVKNNLETNLQGAVPESLVNKISKIDGIKNYDAVIHGAGLDIKEISHIEPTKNTIQYSYEEKYKNLFTVEGHSSTEFDNKFTSKAFELVEGRHIVENDRNKVLIHKALAEKNNLKVGDIIKATKNPEDYRASKVSKNEYELEIVGLFDSDNTERVGDKTELAENTIISDIYTLKTLYGYSDGNVQYTNAVFQTSGNVEEVISKVNSISNDWSKYTISKSEDNFLALSKSFDTLEKIINMVLIGAIIAGAIILSLVLAFWIQGRIHETGILLSIGVSKFKIISQYVIELLLISVIAFGGSYFSGKVISQNIGNAIVSQASKQAVQEVKSGFGGFNLGTDPETSLVTRTVDKIDVKVEFKELIYVYVIGTVIIILSVMVSSASIIRLKPKEILSKMS